MVANTNVRSLMDVTMPPLTRENIGWFSLLATVCDEGPLTSLEQELETMAARDHPGFLPVWEPEALKGYLQRWQPKLKPYFPLGFLLASKILLHYSHDLRKKSEAGETPDLFWLARLAYRINPSIQRMIDEAPSDWGAEQFRPPGPVHVSPYEWPLFLKAFEAWRSLEVPVGEEGGVGSETLDKGRFAGPTDYLHHALFNRLDECVYAQREVIAVATRLIEGAIPYTGPGGCVLVVPCGDPRSLRLQNIAAEVVARQTNTDLRQTIIEARIPETERIQAERVVWAALAYSLGMRPNEIAEQWIFHGLVKTEHAIVDPELGVLKPEWYEGDHLASGARAVREARAILEKADLGPKKSSRPRRKTGPDQG
jgi:hypothetical protein